MDHRILNALGIALIIMVGAFASCAIYFTWDQHQSQVAARADLAGAARTFAEINRPCQPVSGHVYKVGEDKPCGTLADINQTLRTVRGTFGQIEVGAQHYDYQLSTIDRDVAQASSDLHAVLQETRSAVSDVRGTAKALATTADAATVTLGAATSALGEGQKTIAATKPLLSQAKDAVGHLDAQISNPKIAELIAHGNDIADNTADVTEDTAKVTHHFEQLIDQPNKRTFWGTVKSGWQILWQLGMLAK